MIFHPCNQISESVNLNLLFKQKCHFVIATQTELSYNKASWKIHKSSECRILMEKMTDLHKYQYILQIELVLLILFHLLNID